MHQGGEKMIGIIIGIMVFIFILVLVVSKSKTRPIQRVRLRNELVPENLGIQIAGGESIVRAIDAALSPSYVDNVKNRVLLEHPNWADHEFEWTLFELKRYFIMNSILRSVPMFSSRVDDIWHEMLMFTRDYEKFTKNFYHETLHHTPNLDSTPIPGERAFFDWVYLSLFHPTQNSRVIWGGFLKNPIKREILDDFKHLSEHDLLLKYFRRHDDWMEVKRNLVLKMKNEINEADRIKHGNAKSTFQGHSSQTDSHFLNYALGAAVFYSLYETNQYQEHMSELIPTEFEKEKNGVGAYCSGYACSGSSDDQSGGDSGDSGGSSCSSCGGGCSS